MLKSTLSKTAQRSLATLGKSGVVDKAYLAGGSALALHFGHRISVDLDFFTQAQFDPHELNQQLSTVGTFKQTFSKGISLTGHFNNIQFSYFLYKYPLVVKTTQFLEVNIAHPNDIAAMKLVAICDRGTKKDYVDLYECIQQGVSVEKMLETYDKKYKKLQTNLFSIIKALSYFDEAEATTMPKMLKKVTWKEVKNILRQESLRLAKKYLK